MQVREIPDRSDAFYIINGGFVRISENHVTVLAYDVTTFEGMEEKAIDSLVSHAHSVIAGQEYIRSQQEAMDQKKAKFVVHMAELAGIQVSQAETAE